MTVFDWLARSTSYVQSEGLSAGVSRSADEFKQGAMYRIDKHVGGVSIFEESWDVLIILDACRPDLLSEVVDEYEFLRPEFKTAWSKGSGSRSWMERNFTHDWAKEAEKTAYITGNPFTDELVDSNQFGLLDEVWRYAWNDDFGTVPARPITDRAIETARNRDFNRLLVHYMQPHFPSIADPLGSDINIETFGEEWNSVWDDLEAGNISTDRVWDSYRENLEYVLDDVELLLSSINSEKVVISADHGNAFGEFGFYGHPPYNPIPALRRVPWVETTANDNGSYNPSTEREEMGRIDTDVESRLSNLGYR